MIGTAIVTQGYREEHGLSMRGFADCVNANLVNNFMSSSMVHRIEKGKYEPPLELIFECLAIYPSTSWISVWARDCFRAMYPDLTGRGVVVINLSKSN